MENLTIEALHKLKGQLVAGKKGEPSPLSRGEALELVEALLFCLKADSKLEMLLKLGAVKKLKTMQIVGYEDSVGNWEEIPATKEAVVGMVNAQRPRLPNGPYTTDDLEFDRMEGKHELGWNGFWLIFVKLHGGGKLPYAYCSQLPE